MQSPLKPNAKFDNLVVQEFSDEILIYNLENNKAYSLNQTSKLVWENCDGTKDVSQIASEMAKDLKQEVPDDVVWLALDNLTKEGLISFEGDVKSAFAGFSRREAIKRVGFASMISLPLIASIIAPTPAHAQSVEASLCTDCSMKNDPCVTGCGLVLGNCYDNAGCGMGQFIANITCDQCKLGVIFEGGTDTGSWKQVINP